MDKPVLDTIRAILKFKDTTTLAEVASVAELPKRKVLDILNANKYMVQSDPKTGKIKSVTPRRYLRDKLWFGGAYYQVQEEDYGTKRVLRFNNRELYDKLATKTYFGSLGDSHRKTVVVDTDENRKRLHEEGIVHIDNLVLDDREWTE